jgi:hypothetical protein
MDRAYARGHLHQREGARADLKQAVALDPEGRLGKKAARLLKTLDTKGLK